MTIIYCCIFHFLTSTIATLLSLIKTDTCELKHVICQRGLGYRRSFLLRIPQIGPFSLGSSPKLCLWKVQLGCFNEGMGYVPEDVGHLDLYFRGPPPIPW